MSRELSEVDTEYILEHFKELKDGPFGDLSAALRDLNAMPETLPPFEPPLYPSAVLKNVKPFKRSAKSAGATVIVAGAIAISTTLAASALTGVGPKPLVEFAKSTFKTIGTIGSSVVKFVATPITSTNSNTNTNAGSGDNHAQQSENQNSAVANIESQVDNNVQNPKNQPTPTEDTKIAETKTDHTSSATGRPEVKTTEKPEVKASEKPEVIVSEKPEVKTSEKPEVKASEKPEVKTSASPEVKVSEKPEVKVTQQPDVKVTEKPEVKPAPTPTPAPKPEVKATPEPNETKEADNG